MKIPQSTIRLLTGRLVKILLNREVSIMKFNTQNAKIKAITENTLVLGIDVGSETHYARAFDYRGIEYSKKPFKFSNDEAGFMSFKAWILDIEEKHGKDKAVPGMEPTGHYWFKHDPILARRCLCRFKNSIKHEISVTVRTCKNTEQD